MARVKTRDEFTSEKNSQRTSKLKKEAKEWGRSLFYGLLFVFFFTNYFFKAYKVEGTSMQPLLQDGERIFVNRYIYMTDPLPLLKWKLPLTREPDHGDVVVFWFPREPTKYFIKRVIGVPGDSLRIRNGIIYINKVKVNDDFIPRAFKSYNDKEITVVPQGYYFCVGDHRNKSYDSRQWGYVPRKYIIGKAVLRYWPPNEFGLIRYERNPSFFAQN